MNPLVKTISRQPIRALQRTLTTNSRAAALTKNVLEQKLRVFRLQQSRRTMVVVTKTAAGSLNVENNYKENNITMESPALVNNTNMDNVTITENCWNRIKTLVSQRNLSEQEMYLRLYVDAGGCSGFQYKFELTLDKDEAVDADEDVVFYSSDDKTRVVIDKTSLNLVHGSTLDFVQEMIKSAFVVTENPQSESACGCGSSFAIKNFESNPAMD